MTLRISTALTALTVLLATGCSKSTVESVAKSAVPRTPNPMPLKSVPTFSTENLGRRGNFYVAGRWEGEPGKERMRGAMYVEVWVPKASRHPYPIVFIQGAGGQSNIALLQTPDGRPGWAYDFLNQGYTVYMMDYPGQGRSGYIPGVDGEVTPPRSGPLMSEIWTQSIAPSLDKTAPGPNGSGAPWPQFSKYSAWPSDHPNKGRMGDPVFDYFAKTELHSAGGMGELTVHAVVDLLDLIGKPVILLLHSGVGGSGWNVADARPALVKGIVAAEPVSPPMENTERRAPGNYTPGRLWGLTSLPITYDPPAKEATELRTVRQEKADGPGLIPCWIQQEPARKLTNLQAIPVLNVAGEASYHRPYAHCTAKWLNQAGVKTTFVGLESVGLFGNGHQFLSESNSDGIAKYFMRWLDQNVQ
jgi:pimeloyl-ACP methyl ester carboxylesterase